MRLAVHAVLSVQPILVCPAAPAFTHDPDDNRAAKANDGESGRALQSNDVKISLAALSIHTIPGKLPCAGAIDRSTGR
jgi:hypothetical protein